MDAYPTERTSGATPGTPSTLRPKPSNDTYSIDIHSSTETTDGDWRVLPQSTHLCQASPPPCKGSSLTTSSTIAPTTSTVPLYSIFHRRITNTVQTTKVPPPARPPPLTTRPPLQLRQAHRRPRHPWRSRPHHTYPSPLSPPPPHPRTPHPACITYKTRQPYFVQDHPTRLSLLHYYLPPNQL